MAHHYYYDFSAGQTPQQLIDSGWQLSSVSTNNVHPNWTTTHFPRHPVAGHGGMKTGIRISLANSAKTLAFPKGPLTDGIMQVHAYHTVRHDNGYDPIEIYAADDTLLLRLEVNASKLFEVKSGEGGTPTLRATCSIPAPLDTWYVLAVRFKPGLISGEIEVTFDGVTVATYSGDVGALSSWSKVLLRSSGGQPYHYYAGLNVYDNPATDNALTVTKWTAALRPIADDTDGSFLNQAGSALNMYQSIDETTLSTADYITTTTNPDESRFSVQTSDIDAAWAPAVIDAVGVTVSCRGEGALNATQVSIDDGVDNDLGVAATTDADSSTAPSDAFVFQSDGVSVWSVAEIDTHTFGIKVS